MKKLKPTVGYFAYPLPQWGPWDWHWSCTRCSSSECIMILTLIMQKFRLQIQS